MRENFKDNNRLSLTESSNFQYLLELMMPLHGEEEYACLPELFSILGHDKLLLLCKYAGGTIIKIPTIQELLDSMEALEWFYKVYIEKSKYRKSIPENLRDRVDKIKEVYGAQ